MASDPPTVMEEVFRLKEKANERYKKAVKGKPEVIASQNLYKEACHLYAQAIEAIGAYEVSQMEAAAITSSKLSLTLEEERLKPQLFLNLGMANAKLGEYLSCRQCCNVALHFCNDASAPLCDLPEMTDDIALLLPVVGYAYTGYLHMR